MPHSPWPFLDQPGPLAFAHRGGAGEWPENTMPAFENAVSLGYRYVETDVHATADGVLVAFHDDSLDRVTDRSGKIADLPWSTVAEARVDGREPIPRLDDLLGAWPDLRVNLDAKADRAVQPLAEVVRRTGSLERVCVGSFSGARLTEMRRLLPGVCTSSGPLAIGRLWLAGFGVPLGRPAAACAQVPVRKGPVPVTTRRFVEAAHRRALQVHVWTIDDPAEMTRLLDLGVDGLMTDLPAVLKEVLVRRGEWVGS